eukprot:1140913-Pelagomonas_calceolata.AAC.5
MDVIVHAHAHAVSARHGIARPLATGKEHRMPHCYSTAFPRMSFIIHLQVWKLDVAPHIFPWLTQSSSCQFHSDETHLGHAFDPRGNEL